jgi:osmotically-inducible protein OsmY
VRGLTNRITLKKTVARADVRGELQRIFHRDAQIDANNVRITCEGSTITLSGTVHSWFERNEASRAAWSVKGVTAVDNRITVVPA